MISAAQTNIVNAGRYVMSLKKNEKRENQKTYWGTHKKVKVRNCIKK